MSEPTKAELLEQLEKLQAENEALKSASAVSVDVPASVASSGPDPDDELVEVELFYDGEKYKDDLDICINGERILLQRGKKIKIKRKYALVLEQSINQDKHTKNLMMKYASEYERSASVLS